MANLIGSDGDHYISLDSFDAVSKTSITYLGIRADGDVNDSPPSGNNQVRVGTGSAGADHFIRITFGSAALEPVYPSAGIIMIE